MTGRRNQLVVLTAVLVVYFLAYSVLRTLSNSAWAGWVNLIVQVSLNVLTVWYAVWLRRQSARSTRLLAAAVGTAAVFGVVSDGCYNYLVNVAGRVPGLDVVSTFYFVSYSVFLLGWVGAWAAAVTDVITHRTLEGRLVLLILTCLSCIAALFFAIYFPLVEATLGYSTIGVFHAVFTVLQVLGICLGIVSVVFVPARLYVLLLLGYSTTVAVDFVLRGEEITAGRPPPVHLLEAFWTLGQSFTVLALAWEVYSSGRRPGAVVNYTWRPEGARAAGVLVLSALPPLFLTALVAIAVGPLSYRATLMLEILVGSTVTFALGGYYCGLALTRFGDAVTDLFRGRSQPHPTGLLGLVWRLMSLNDILKLVQLRISRMTEQPMASPHPANVVILFLAADPANGIHLKLDDEARAIEQRIRASDYRDTLILLTKWAVRPDDLLQYLNQHKPHVVHFSGHASRSEEIVLVADDGQPKPVDKRALRSLFHTLRDNIRIVVLNACFSRPQAEAIAEDIDCTVGMKEAIGDKAAITFSAAFYRALGFGRSVKNSFDQGVAAMQLEGIGEDSTPELLVRDGVDPTQVFLVTGVE
jgi:hypothetical protein